ncbi:MULTISPECIES: hypothetical protein [unclassified Moorena]|uniref:hypothetical protein n=1 Tax=unclassified Moorena TaxID=2683338 RepID=UPI0014010FAA|nr:MULTISPECIES: hypothetical protein [unclassified Moorena]NEO13484.1 hypothetical protein [Moorena sp. SIO3E8]NEP98428.1 hypothetical protein [Moorena sp. SIO3F7]
MSLTPENRIEAFIDLIKHQPSVFLAENRMDLEQQIDKFPEDVASLSNTISDWCKKYPDIRKALSKTRKSLFGSRFENHRGQTDYIPAANPKEDYKTNIKNQMRESFPETTKEQKPQDTNK